MKMEKDGENQLRLNAFHLLLMNISHLILNIYQKFLILKQISQVATSPYSVCEVCFKNTAL